MTVTSKQTKTQKIINCSIASGEGESQSQGKDMALINKILNILLPIVTVSFLLVFMPFSIFFKLLGFIRRCKESEKVDGKVVIITGSSSGIGEVSSMKLLIPIILLLVKTKHLEVDLMV